jgi:hypothetical protein
MVMVSLMASTLTDSECSNSDFFVKRLKQIPISVRQNVFASLTQAMDRPDLNARFFAPNFLHIPETLPSLRAYLTQLYAMLLDRSEILQQPDFQQLIRAC